MFTEAFPYHIWYDYVSTEQHGIVDKHNCFHDMNAMQYVYILARKNALIVILTVLKLLGILIVITLISLYIFLSSI